MGNEKAGERAGLTENRFKQIAGLVKETSNDTKTVMQTLFSGSKL